MRDLVKRQVQFGEHPKYYYEIFGLSTEKTNLPTDAATGSMFTEQDTAIVNSYNEEVDTWYPVINLGGGS